MKKKAKINLDLENPGGCEEEENNDDDNKDDDCICHSVNKISNCSHISFFSRTTHLIKSDSTNTH